MCIDAFEGLIMSRTNVVINEQLMAECMEVTGLKTKKSVIDYALRELLRKNSQKKVLDLQGKINWDGDLTKMRQTR